MSNNLIQHVPNPEFWRKYYLDQAKGNPYARAKPADRIRGQRGAGESKRRKHKRVVKLVSPVEQANQRAQSQIKRRLKEVGGVNKKRKTSIKGRTSRPSVTHTKGKRESNKSRK